MSRTVMSSGIFVASFGLISLFQLNAAEVRSSERVGRFDRDVRVVERLTERGATEFVELTAGARFARSSRLEETVEEIRIDSIGAVADTGPHQVPFKVDIYEVSPVAITTSDAITLKSGMLGIAYFDHASGRSVVHAEVKPAQGYLDEPNRVVYLDPFDGLLADVRYTYLAAGLEQDVILRQNPPAPEVFGLDSETTSLEVWSEFFEGVPTDKEVHVRPEARTSGRTNDHRRRYSQ